MLKNEIIEVGGRNWLVREAMTREVAEDVIALARCMGSVSLRRTTCHPDKSETVDADVVRLNADGAECKPS